MTEQKFIELYAEYVSGAASLKEVDDFLAAVNSGKFDELLNQLIASTQEQEPHADIAKRRSREIFEAILSSSARVRGRMTDIYLVAASVVTLCCLGAWYYLVDFDVSTNVAIQPGADKATLQLSDGRLIALDSSSEHLLISEGDVALVSENGTLIYETKPKEASAEEVYHTVSTPRGGQYKLELADGTKVWLNADSKITYPVVFTGLSREVKIEGEAYFEVAQVSNQGKRMPFVVAARDMFVHVLGTHFNVMAYEDEASIKTTLLEGSVKVKADRETLLLKPGEQSLYTQGILSLNEAVDTRSAIAWKSGYFRYKNTNIVTIMNQLGRWYDVDVEYEDETVKNHAFGGVISRKDSVASMLELMELTGAVKFAIEGKRILVRAGN